VKGIEATLIISIILVILVVFAFSAHRAGDNYSQHRGPLSLVARRGHVPARLSLDICR